MSFKFTYLPLLLVDGGITIEQGHSGGIISTVLESLQAFDKYRVSIPGSNITNNSTHKTNELSDE
jgi:hypothetical protein